MSVLSKEDHKFWDENGYVIIHEAVPPENIKAAADAIWDFWKWSPTTGELVSRLASKGHRGQTVSSPGYMGQPSVPSAVSSLCRDLENGSFVG
jgi:hypothetical protein